jgi:competence protein ComEA
MQQRMRIGVFFVMVVSAIAVLFLVAAPEKEADEAYIHLQEEADEETAEMSSAASELLQEDENAGEQERMAEEEPEEPDYRKTAEEKPTICVYVCGKVKKPGVYELSEDSRLYDFIKAAGGFTKKAAKEYWNLAGKAEDGQKLYVPSKKEAAVMEKNTEASVLGTEAMQEAGGSKSDGKADSEKVNINTAGKEELMTLSGIGEAKAEAIISYREANGTFHSIEELMQISGIKEGIYQKISEDITI